MGPTIGLPDFTVRLIASIDREMRMVLPELGRERICDSPHAKNVLPWMPRPAEETIVDAAHSRIAARLVQP